MYLPYKTGIHGWLLIKGKWKYTAKKDLYRDVLGSFIFNKHPRWCWWSGAKPEFHGPAWKRIPLENLMLNLPKPREEWKMVGSARFPSDCQAVPKMEMAWPDWKLSRSSNKETEGNPKGRKTEELRLAFDKGIESVGCLPTLREKERDGSNSKSCWDCFRRQHNSAYLCSILHHPSSPFTLISIWLAEIL